MPDEEMEMAVDFSQAVFGEDIDIDLDFPAAQPDEDMDLGDFDRVHDIHNFNSDTRDELMAEGDDSSYAMIDAIETDHNTSAVAANDIDIELEQAVENIWQQDPPHPADFNLDAEIDYLDETTVENMDAERNDMESSEWLPAVAPSQDAGDTMDHAARVSVEIFTALEERHEELPQEDSIHSYGDAPGIVKTLHPDSEPTYSLPASGLKESSQTTKIDDLPGDEAVEVVAQDSRLSSVAESDEHGISQPIADADVQSHSPSSVDQASNKQRETDYSNEVVQAGSDHTDMPLVSHELERPEHLRVTELDTVEDDHADHLSLEEADESADDSSEYQLGGESYIETTNDQTGVDYVAPPSASSVPDGSGSPATGTGPTRDLTDYHNEAATIPSIKSPVTQVNDRDNPIELADHYGIYISYGETDYQLFAKSEDDDPNQYFLTDKSALDIPLAQFLTSLRDVISEEISPLDDLVLQVDGLGLEFSESTTPDFLEKFTFGDLVILYDKLAKNELAESSPPIYTYLTVKPNCTRRMMALGESANAGRGLSEVALYNDSSSVDGEQVHDGISPETDFSADDYDDGESGNPYPQAAYEEGDTSNDDRQQELLLVPTEAPLEHSLDHSDATDNFNNDNKEPSVDGSADSEDREQNSSTSTQGIYPFILQSTFSCTQDSDCSCEECYELELQHLATPTQAEVWPTPGTEADEHGEESSPKTAEGVESKLRTPKITTPNLSTDILNSENTSVTATLDGEDHDEIDYNSDEDGESNYDGVDESDLQKQPSRAATESNVPVDDEITWESDDEEAKHETKVGLITDTVQVSPVSGKRTRSDSDSLDSADDKSDYKRRRS
ncbi:hypothetical protein ONZ43_g2807 [Nemania bipapillata]|uniref:Uncharacterized protein n=1 Tax=Nemania bipapillata TaxID=110536 RepID=A0ACC2IZ43_9PEZI|nr:hypothetical protein ONZ43_g2807 [Nemania bipapillata]